MRLVFLATLLLVGCGAGSANDERTVEDLFDEAVGMYCVDGPVQECRERARIALVFAETDEMPREDILVRMVDDLDPEMFPGFEEAMWESVRDITFGR